MSNENFVMSNDAPVGGVFIGEATILSARSVSGTDVYKNSRPVDVGIEFTLDIGKDFQPTFVIAGNFKVENGVVKPGGATRVKIALNRLKVKWDKLGPNNEIPADVLSQCTGKRILRLQYPYAMNEETKKPKYATFSEFFLADHPDARRILRAKYDEAVAAGYIKTLKEDDATAFPPTDAAPAPTGSGPGF